MRELIMARIALYEQARASALQTIDIASRTVIESEAALRELHDLIALTPPEETKADGG